MKKIIIVAESGSDIPKEYVERYGLHILPMYVNFEGESLEDGSFPVEKIFRYHKETRKLPSTSAVSPEAYMEIFRKIHEENPQAVILHLCYSAVTTCTWQNALIASEDMDYVRHIDTKSVSAGQTAIILRTAKYLEDHPQTGIDEICQKLEEWIKDIRMYFFPGDLEYLRAGGRVSNAAYLGATLLSIKPLIKIDNGYLVAGKKYRGPMEKVSKKLVTDSLGKGELSTEEIYLIYSEGLSNELRHSLEDMVHNLGAKKVMWIGTGGVISTHSGSGAFGIAGYRNC